MVMNTLPQKFKKLGISAGKSCLRSLFVLLGSFNFANAQTEMADTLRSNGKIYVVVTVLATIFAGIFAYLVVLDRRIGKMEKQKQVH